MLGISQGAGRRAIKQAFRKAARKTHPDANPDDPKAKEKFQLVNEANMVLSDPVGRAAYDRTYLVNREQAERAHKRAAARTRKAKKEAARARKAREEAARTRKAKKEAARARKAREEAARARKAREEAARARKAKEEAARARKAREEAARARKAREEAERARKRAEAARIRKEAERRRQQAASATTQAGGSPQARKWALPTADNLTRPQKAALRMATAANTLILGNAGTGKTVVLVHKALELARQKTPFVFLTYNIMLRKAIAQLDGLPRPLGIDQTMSWFLWAYSQLVGEPVPRHNPARSGFRPINWLRTLDSLKQTAKRVKRQKRREWILIDQGLHVPIEFYQCLRVLGYTRIVVAANLWQRKPSVDTSWLQLQRTLGIHDDQVAHLRDNLRCSFGVERLAQHFLPARDRNRTLAPKRDGFVHTPKLYSYTSDTNAFGQLIRDIIDMALSSHGLLVGVLTPNNQVRSKYVDALQQIHAEMGSSGLTISTYAYGDRAETRFDQGGIMVLNQQTCNGLDFDRVVLADINKHWVRNHDLEALRRRFYKMITRARKTVHLIMNRDKWSLVQSILPNDKTVLQRVDL